MIAGLIVAASPFAVVLAFYRATLPARRAYDLVHPTPTPTEDAR